MLCLPFPPSSRSYSNPLDDEKLPSAYEPSRRPLNELEPGFPAANFRTSPSAEDERAHALIELKREMEERKLDVYVVPSEDEHLSEYVSNADKRREFITGFSGSAGTALIYRDQQRNVLYVDSRYWIQAAHQVPSNWVVKRVGDKGQVDWATDLIENAASTTRVGIDPRLISAGSGAAHSASILPLIAAPNLHIVSITTNLVDLVWSDRPSRSHAEINIHPLKFAGVPSQQKLQDLLQSKTFSSLSPPPRGFFLQTLDEIAWILNLRSEGGDVPFCPVFHAYLYIPFSPSNELPTLFIDPRKLSPSVADYLSTIGVSTKAYSDVWSFLQTLRSSPPSYSSENAKHKEEGKIATSLTMSWAVELALGKESTQPLLSPILESKATKNDVELEGMRAAYLRDGRATVRWLTKVERMIRKEAREVREFEAGEMLTGFRQQETYFRGLAYENISASGPNAALPHYSPSPHPGQSRLIDRKTPYVNDSGAQYLDGTIDTTRTMHFGKPTRAQRDTFTRVLQGHIVVDTTVFPEGTSGASMNALARGPLWKEGLDFAHGVGHGIGSYLNVHEGPQGIPLPYPFKPGHVISIEPGYYLEGEWGMRHESAVVVEKKKTAHNQGGKDFYGFSRLTRVPISPNLVNTSLLSPFELAWLKAHNAQCYDELTPLLGDLPKGEREEVKKFLKECCRF